VGEPVLLERTVGTTGSAELTLRWYFGLVWPDDSEPDLRVLELRDTNDNDLSFDITVDGEATLSCTENFGNALLQIAYQNDSAELALSWRYDDTTCDALTEALDAGESVEGATLASESAVLALDDGDRVYTWERDTDNEQVPSALHTYASECLPEQAPIDDNPSEPIAPYLSCFSPPDPDNEDDAQLFAGRPVCTAGFGYVNPNPGSVQAEADTVRNEIIPVHIAALAGDELPSLFEPGNTTLAFYVRYPCNDAGSVPLIWRVRTPLSHADYAAALPDSACDRQCAHSLKVWFRQCPGSPSHSLPLSMLDENTRLMMRCASTVGRTGVPLCEG
jgi:hypothetical protein